MVYYYRRKLKTNGPCHSFYYPTGSENPHAFFMPLLWPDAPGWVRLPKEAEAQVVSQSKRTERKIQKFSSMAAQADGSAGAGSLPLPHLS